MFYLHIYVFTYQPTIYLLMSYLFTYLPMFYLFTYLPTIYLPSCIYLSIYLVKYLFTYLWKIIKVQMLLYTLKKKFMEVQGNMLNTFGFNLFYKVVDGLIAKTLVWNQGDQSSIPFTNIYYVKYLYS